MNLIGSIIAWAVFGLIIGAIARLLYPGRQSMSIFMTMVLGIVGSLVGGFLTWAVGFGDPNEGAFHGAGWIMSIVGALVVVWIGIFATTNRPATGQRLP